MVNTHQVLAFGLAAFILIAIPGPSVVFVIGRALAYGRRVALATVLGNSLGLLGVLALVSLGLGAVVSGSAVVFTVLKVAGAAYLVWLGIQAIRHREGIEVPADPDRAERPGGRAPQPRGRAEQVGGRAEQPGGRAQSRPLPWRTALRQGFVVGFSNPKAFLIFAAVLPQFLDRDGSPAQVQMLLLGLVAFAIGIASDSLWALTASQLRSWFDASPGRGRALGTLGGVSMIGLGVGMAITGRPD